MGNSKLRGKDLSRIGISNDTHKSIALDILSKHFKKLSRSEQLNILQKVMAAPEDFLDDERLGQFASFWQESEVEDIKEKAQEVVLHAQPLSFSVFGKKGIEQGAIRQMEQVMQLPIAEKGALMPDAHQGYGLPIGGVLATKNAVLPYGVGMDIGCRMCLTIYDVRPSFVKQYKHQIKQSLLTDTHFGLETLNSQRYEHEVLDRPEFNMFELTRKLHGKAQRQLGTSGSGNHFVEVGLVDIPEDTTLGIDAGEYVAILSHSGSRGLGAEIARYYTDLASKRVNLPKGYRHLAWLDMDSEVGQEYWTLMQLAGEYAQACHETIHYAMGKTLGLKPVAKIENHHNFAWKEVIDGEEYIVHRKGATPAAEGVYGIIPGSMTAPGFIVRGLGNSQGLLSASHGAGRKIPRKQAKSTITGSDMRKQLKNSGVELIGGQVDEAPMVYKDIHKVMEEQKGQVAIEGVFQPKVVRMDKR